ncbi:CHASE2 domain-containing protein [Maribacter sp. Asnod2-G09]|uniref:CHASE2 domain-containing protein n=1 Tax=Maribacter sp. Asnod2-G09 TaxID=3160577 RepID=UPI00386D40D2
MIKTLLRKIAPPNGFLLFKEAFFCMLFSFLVVAIVAIIGLNLSFFNPFKNAFKDFSYLDLYYAEKLNDDNFDLNDKIVLVNIDRLNRKEIADLLDEVQKHKPKVIGLDVIFKEKTDPVWDNFLANKLKNDAFVFAYAIFGDKEIETHSSISNTEGNKGYSNFNFNKESIVIRNFQGIMDKDTQTLVSFPVLVAQKYLQNNWLSRHEFFLKKERPINYTGNRDNFLILERKDIVDQETMPFLKDKIILVGYLGNENNYIYDIEDKHYTPMNKKFVGKSPPDTFGLIIHANIIQMLLTNNYITIVPNWVLVLLTILLTFVGLAYFIYLNKRQLASYILRLNLVQLLFIAIFTWISLLFFKNGILFKITVITAVVVFSLGLIGYYKKLSHYLYKKYKWEGYFYHD